METKIQERIISRLDELETQKKDCESKIETIPDQIQSIKDYENIEKKFTLKNYIIHKKIF